jgi:hypothetical protein
MVYRSGVFNASHSECRGAKRAEQGLHRVSTPSEEDKVKKGSSDLNLIRVADTVAAALCRHHLPFTHLQRAYAFWSYAVGVDMRWSWNKQVP